MQEQNIRIRLGCKNKRREDEIWMPEKEERGMIL